MNRKMVLILPLLLLIPITLAMDPPGIMWTKESDSPSYFANVHETSGGGFIVAGWKGEGLDHSVFLFSSSGDSIWEYSVSGYGFYQLANWVEEVPSGGYIATGNCRPSSSSKHSLFLARIDAEGNEVWRKIYGLSGVNLIGYCVIPLPDGGYAVCGKKDPSSGGDQAWLLRTDANGDTLWTREWGWTNYDRAMRVLYVDGGLTVLMHGSTQYTSAGPHLARYDMEGNLLWDTPITELAGYGGQDICIGTNGGYTLLSQYATYIAHTDDQGNVLWMELALGSGWMYGWAISPTMDGGYIYGGENRPIPPLSGSEAIGEVTDSDYSGMVVRYDQDGNELWWDYVYNEECMVIFSIRQLSQGGYIAAGYTINGTGLLLRYEPETGISDGEGLPAMVSLGTPHPNPSSGEFSIPYSLPASMQVELSVYDLGGRMIENLYLGISGTGQHEILWSAEEIPSGCYIVVLRTEEGIDTSRCVLMR